MYRPTVRYDDVYKSYVEDVFKATTLDKNQIIRLALFAAPFSPLFNAQLKKHMTSSLPSPNWEVTEHGLWLEQTYQKREEGSDVNDKKETSSGFLEMEIKKQSTGYSQVINKKEEKIESPAQPRLFKNTGGIKITL